MVDAEPRAATNRHVSLPVMRIAFALILGAQAACADRPNLVFVLADDLGWCDVSTGLTNLGNANRFVETPAIERLAAEGVAFTNAYTAGPNCAPTRAAHLTGRYAPHPMNNVFNVGNLRRGPRDSLLVGAEQGLPSGKDGIPNDAVTYAELLQSAGYRTAHFGKFHVAEREGAAEDILNHHGFHENHGGNHRGAPKRYHAKAQRFGPHVEPELDAFAADYTADYVDANVRPFSVGVDAAVVSDLVGEPKHLTDGLTDAAIDFMTRCGDQPFLVQFNSYAAHTPIGPRHARSDLLRKYRDKAGAGFASAASFAALVEGIDQSVARVLRFLETTPDPRHEGRTLAENTVVVFSSDNGGKLPQSDNGPLRGEKGELYEGGVRVPLIVWSKNPDLVARRRVLATPVTSVDFLPTFASMAGARVDASASDGVDLTPVLSGSTNLLQRDAIFWHFPGYLVDSSRQQRPQSVVRSGPWKLMYSYETQRHELYNLDDDLGETTNRVDDEPTVAAQLSRRLLAWLCETHAPLATLRKGTITIDSTRPCYPNTTADGDSLSRKIAVGELVPYVAAP